MRFSMSLAVCGVLFLGAALADGPEDYCFSRDNTALTQFYGDHRACSDASWRTLHLFSFWRSHTIETKEVPQFDVHAFVRCMIGKGYKLDSNGYRRREGMDVSRMPPDRLARQVRSDSCRPRGESIDANTVEVWFGLRRASATTVELSVSNHANVPVCFAYWPTGFELIDNGHLIHPTISRPQGATDRRCVNLPPGAMRRENIELAQFFAADTLRDGKVCINASYTAGQDRPDSHARRRYGGGRICE